MFLPYSNSCFSYFFRFELPSFELTSFELNSWCPQKPKSPNTRKPNYPKAQMLRRTIHIEYPTASFSQWALLLCSWCKRQGDYQLVMQTEDPGSRKKTRKVYCSEKCFSNQRRWENHPAELFDLVSTKPPIWTSPKAKMIFTCSTLMVTNCLLTFL